jgi:hypothetical protein
MPDRADQILSEVFRAAAADPVAARLAPALADAYRDGRWSADNLQMSVDAWIDEQSAEEQKL